MIVVRYNVMDKRKGQIEQIRLFQNYDNEEAEDCYNFFMSEPQYTNVSIEFK